MISTDKNQHILIKKVVTEAKKFLNNNKSYLSRPRDEEDTFAHDSFLSGYVSAKLEIYIPPNEIYKFKK